MGTQRRSSRTRSFIKIRIVQENSPFRISPVRREELNLQGRGRLVAQDGLQARFGNSMGNRNDGGIFRKDKTNALRRRLAWWSGSFTLKSSNPISASETEVKQGALQLNCCRKFQELVVCNCGICSYSWLRLPAIPFFPPCVWLPRSSTEQLSYFQCAGGR